MDNEKEIRKIREMAGCIKEIIRNEEETYLECNEPLCCHRKILIPLLDFFLSLYGDPWDVERVVPGLNICLQNALRNAMAEKKRRNEGIARKHRGCRAASEADGNAGKT